LTVKAVAAQFTGGHVEIQQVSLEMEDLTMSVESGVRTSIDALKQMLSF
jgi:hypothetical protein